MTTEAPETPAGSEPDELGHEADTSAGDAVVRQALIAGAVLGALGLLGLLLAGLQLVFPDLAAGIAFLSYGRLYPVATNLIVFGCLTLSAVAVAFYVVPRATGRSVDIRWAAASVGLTVLAVLAGVAGIALGFNDGRELLDMPVLVDVFVAAGLLLATAAVTMNRGDDTSSSPSSWFAVAGLWWMVLTFVVGNAPIVEGVNESILNGFFIAGYLLVGLGSVAIAAAYHLVGAQTAWPFGGRVSRIALWSLLFVAGWTGQRFFVYGPGPDWLETIAVAFAIALVIPLVAVMADLGAATRGRWSELGSRPEMKLAALGGVALVLAVVVHLLQGLRAPSLIVQFTAWDAAFEVLLLVGAFGSLFAAFAVRTLGLSRDGSQRARRMRGLHLWGTISGLVLFVGAAMASGLHEGYTWVGGSTMLDFADAGDGFRNTVGPLEAWYGVQAIGLGLLVVTQLVWVIALVRGGGSMTEVESVEPDEAALEAAAEDPPGEFATRRLVAAAVGLFALALFSTVVVPSFESGHNDATLLGEARNFETGSLEAQGRRVYVQEGCWYCHTQQVRPVVADAELGPVSVPGDYAGQDPALLGTRRIGPDLMHAGAREPTDSVRWNAEHLTDPRGAADPTVRRPWSIMPAYDYLSDEDLIALAQYIAGLK